MKFTESKAAALIEQHSLSPSTLAVWRSRGAIPDKYERGIKQPIDSEAEQQQASNLLHALQSGKLHLSSLCRLAELPTRYPMNDFMQGRGTLKKDDLLALKKAINYIRNDVKRVLDNLERRGASPDVLIAIEKLLNRPEVAWYVVFDRNRPLWGKFEGWTGGRRSFPEEERDQLKGCLLIFLTETAI